MASVTVAGHGVHFQSSQSISQSSTSTIMPEQGHGHSFNKKTFHKPTYCHHCTDMLWGLIGQGYICEVCNFVVHDRCLKGVVSPCSTRAPHLIKNPVGHCFSEPMSIKRKFCNVCRKRIEDSVALRCEICEYYVHVECQELVVNDCSECATYIPQLELSSSQHRHHWREGNLPGNAKCLVCRKTCWSSECLTGMKCEWCAATCHANCFKTLPEECNFGVLRDILLPPSCLSVPRMAVSVENLMGVSLRKHTSTGRKSALSFLRKRHPFFRTVSEDWSSSGDSRENEEGGGVVVCDKRSPKDKEPKIKEKDDSLVVVKVFDGNTTLKRRQFRPVTVPKTASGQQLLDAALKTFRITEGRENYYISDASDPSSERALELHGAVCAQVRPVAEGRRPCIFLRHREPSQHEEESLVVYPRGHLLMARQRLQGSHSPCFRRITVNRDTSSRECVTTMLNDCGLETADPAKYHMLEVHLDSGVTERALHQNEKPLQLIHQLRQDSVRGSQLTRFYMQQKEDPHGPHIAMFVGNLPTSLSQKEYQKILLDIVGRENKWLRIDVIYYEYGALVLLFTTSEVANRAYDILRGAVFDDKHLMVLLLPNIQPRMIPDHVSPILVFVNVRSGGCQGQNLIRAFRHLLNPHQVFNLENGGPLPGLYVFRNIPYYRVLACGGDGTIGWVLSCLDNVGQDAMCSSPPMAIMPLGTGNDLARVLRWGAGYTGGEDPLNILRDVIDADEIKLDRWTVIFHPNEKEQDETRIAIAIDSNSANTNEDNTTMLVMNNYFGIGIDADVCLDFHNAREENPEKFNSRLQNKFTYVKKGLRKIVNRRACQNLQRQVRVEVDGKNIDLPQVEGLVILNILSWGSGSNPWGPEKEDQFAYPTHYDGLLEVVGVTGVVHLGQIQSGLRSGIRIAQGAHLRITLLSDTPVQVDGEPWLQPAGQVVVLRSALKATMLKKMKKNVKRRSTESSFFFPSRSVEPSCSTPSPGAPSLSPASLSPASAEGATGGEEDHRKAGTPK